MGQSALYLAAVSVVARTPGFLIPIMIATVFGAGSETDAYFLAYGAVLLAGGTLAQGVESAIVHFSASGDGAGRSPHFEDRSARQILVGSFLIWALAVPLVVMAAPGALAGTLLRYALLFTPLAALWPVCAVYTGGLVARWRIAQASLSMLWRGAGALLGVAAALLGMGLAGVIVGLALGEMARLWWLRSQVWRASPPAGRDPVISTRRFMNAASAQVLAAGASTSAPFVERLLATTLGTGGVSRLEYAARLLVVPAVLFEGGLAPLHLTRWSNELAAGRSPSARQVAAVVGKGVALAAVIAGLLVLSAPFAVRLFLGHGRLSGADVAAISYLLRLFAAGFVATMGATLLERLYLAHAKNRLLAALAVGRALVRLALVVIFLRNLGLPAFAAGYAVGEWVYLFALIASVRRSGITT